MSEFLDKLAMEVSAWGKGGGVFWFEATNGEIVASGDRWAHKIVKSQWLQRRQELINEPCDSDAPEWAEWVAQDAASGDWYWYGDMPILYEGREVWAYEVGKCNFAGIGKVPAGHDWRDTRRKVERKVCDGVDASELPHCFGVDSGAEENSPASIQELCILIDTTDDHIARLMLQATLAQVLEREYGVDLSND